jgi:hypothetical protein
MKKAVPALVVLVALWAAYIIWPLFSLFELVRAAQAGDAAAIVRRVDFPAMRRSIAGQVVETYTRLSGLRMERTGLIGFASAFADPLIEKLITPAVLAEIVRGGWPSTVLAEQPAGTRGFGLGALNEAWRLFVNSDYGIGEVRIFVPVDQPKDKQFRVLLALSGGTWKLAGLDLPAELQERLARELMKLQNKAG